MANNKINSLPAKKQRYIVALSEEKSRRQAAISAGYSESYASKAKSHIETADVKLAFQELMRSKIPAGKIVRRIREGMDAVNTEFFAHQGVVVSSRDTINYRERREYTTLAAQMGGYYAPKQEIDVTQKVDENTVRRLTDISDKLNLLDLSNEELKMLDSSHITLDMQEHTIERANSAYDRAMNGGGFKASEKVIIEDKDE